MLESERGNLKIIGLGLGKLKGLTLAAYEALKKVDRLFIKTKEHPAVSQLVEREIEVTTFDMIYETETESARVDEQISRKVIEQLNQKTEVGYAVPGNPLIAEESVQNLLNRLPEERVEIISGESFLGSIFTHLDIDSITGMQVLDGLNFRKEDISIEQNLILTQVYNQIIASDVKLKLLEIYPEEHSVQVIKVAGESGLEKLTELPLYKLDRLDWADYLTSIHIPPVKELEGINLNRLGNFKTLVGIMEKLRGPDGCPWDLKQDHNSLRPYLIEETYEVLERIEAKDISGLCEELGDLLLQVVFHAQVAKEAGNFVIGDVICNISEKMIRRHPHVFGDENVHTANDVLQNWEQIKATEKSVSEPGAESLLKITKGLPALMEAQKIQEKAAEVGFDWSEMEGAINKLEEELMEFKEALTNNKTAIREELGDILFAIVNVGRFLDLNLELVLRDASRKFKERFQYIESKANQERVKLKEMSLVELEELWQAAKQALRENKGGRQK